jgi:hypothetical protein
MPLDSRTTRALSVVLNEATTAQMTENTRLTQELNQMRNQLASMRRNLNDQWLLDVLHLIDCHNNRGCDGLDVMDDFLEEIVGLDRLDSIHEMSQEEKQRIIPTLCEMGFHVLKWKEEHVCSMTVNWRHINPARIAEWVARSSGVEPCYAYHPATGPLDPRFGQRS